MKLSSSLLCASALTIQFVLAGCVAQPEVRGNSNDDVSHASTDVALLRLALLHPITNGDPKVVGIESARQEIDAARLLIESATRNTGPRVLYDLFDTTNTTLGAQNAARNAISAQHSVIFGAAGYEETKSIYDLSRTSNALLINGLSAASYTGDIGQRFVQTHASSIGQAYVLADQIRVAGQRFVVAVAPDTLQGERLAQHFRARFEARHGEDGCRALIQQYSVYEDDSDTRWTANLRRAVAAGPEAIVLLTNANDASSLLRTDPAQQFAGTFYVATDLSEVLVHDPLPPTVLNRVSGAHDSFDRQSSSYISYLDARKQSATEPSFNLNPALFDAVILLALASEREGQHDVDAVTRSMIELSRPPGEKITLDNLARAFELVADGFDIDYEGASGPLDLTDDGKVGVNFVDVWRGLDSGIELVTSFPLATTDIVPVIY